MPRDLLRSPAPATPATSVSQVLSSRAANGEPSLSFEFFPPKDDAGVEKLWATFDELLEARPDFVSVTYGAGGSNREKSFAIVERMAQQVLTIGHLTAVGASKASTIEILKRYRDAGVSTILAVRGDSPASEPDALERGELKSALELVELAKAELEFEIGVGAHPEVHPESPDLAHDAKVLKLKQDAGATFAMTQLFFSLEAYESFLTASRAAGVTLPIVPGLMPVANARNVVRMAELSGAAIPSKLLEAIESAADEEEARQIGMDYTIALGRDLLAAGAPGLHIFTLNRSAAALELARGVGLVS
ncbi:MAG: methylenetetrahydrofolate reductase [Actinomycetales bacterium]|nr:methylenetetrahydrofolate reductase [Actinomycetales bacterium]